MPGMSKHLLSLLSLTALLGAGCGTEESLDDELEPRWGSAFYETSLMAAFNPQFGETPESVAVDADGNRYVSLALTGEIRKIDADGNQSTLAVLPLGNPADCLGPFPGIMGALAIDFWGNLYVPVNSCDLAAKGVYRVSPSGDATMIASLPPEALGNGIALRFGRAYIADSGAPRILRADVDGDGSPAEVWVEDPLLAPTGAIFEGVPLPGANGLQFFGGKVYVANASAATIVAIELEPSGQFDGNLQAGDSVNVFGPEGTGAIWTTDFEEMPGCDDFAFDAFGRIYCTTDPFQTVVRLDQFTGDVDLILDASDGLDGPTATAFGRGADRKTLYVSNAAFPFFPSTGNGPSLLELEVPVGGYPFR
jgi:hypothetical protein